MRLRRRIIEEVKDYLWGDGLDFWNTPRHEVHDFPLTNPLHDIAFWVTSGGSLAQARDHMKKVVSGDYNDFLKKPFDYQPIIGRRRYRPSVSTDTYKSLASSSSSYQQNGGASGTQETPPILPNRTINRMIKNLRNTADRSRWKREGGACPPGYVLKKVKGRWMCVRSSTHKK